MYRKILSCLILVLLCSPVFAKTIINNNTTVVNPTAVVVTEKVQAGPMADAPNLVKISDNWYLGFEGGKDEVYTNTSKGWFGYAKVTYTGTLLDFSKKKVSND